MTEPTPPENVRAVMADGREIPLECEYEGLNEHGQHVWRATMTPTGSLSRLLVDVLPAETTVQIEWFE